MVKQANEDVPVPLIGHGDFVRLKEPYRPSEFTMGQVKESIQRLALAEDVDGLGERFTLAEPPTIEIIRDFDNLAHLTEFTHGTVVEVLSRRNLRDLGPVGFSRHASAEGTTKGFPTRVSLHLFNPETGLLMCGDHPTEPGKPEFVDFHVADLVLVHKADDAWGTEFDIDIAEQYRAWGASMPGGDDA